MRIAAISLALGVSFGLIALDSCASLSRPAGKAFPPTVKAFLDTNGPNLATYEESDVHELAAFFRFDRRYLARARLEQVWAHYVTIDPRVAWKTDMTTLGAVYDPEQDRLFGSASEDLPRFAAGQTFVLELTVAGFLKLPVAFRITGIRPSEHVIEFVYLKKNLSNGFQRISFLDAGDGQGRAYTVIDHESWFRSGHDFRDHFLYAAFHEAIIDAFHWAVLRAGRISASPLAAPDPFGVPAR